METFDTAASALGREVGCPLVFTGSAEEAALVEEIRGATDVPSRSLAGKLSLEELAALLGQREKVQGGRLRNILAQVRTVQS